MAMRSVWKTTVIVLAAAAVVASAPMRTSGGPLDPPPGPVAPTGVTLDEIHDAIAATGAPSTTVPPRGLIAMDSTTSESGIPITGVDTVANFDNVITCIGYGHSVQEFPSDTSVVQAHAPVFIVVPLNRATPQFAKIFQMQDERIPLVRLRFFRPDGAGVMKNYFTIELQDARVVTFTTRAGGAGGEGLLSHSAEISFAYSSIKLIHIEGQTSGLMSWP